MVLEATMIVIDNSESSRNGDYTPSRFEAQSDAVSLLFSAKTQANPESSVGLMTMGGKGPEVLVTLTTDYGKILSGLASTKIKGETHLATGIQVAGLALKHRQNKSQRQRIIVFIGSPIQEDDKSLIKLAKKMKKNAIAIDFVSFGETETNTPKLEAFVEAINSSDNSHLVTIPPGPHLLSDRLVATPIMGDIGGGDAGGSGAGVGGGEDGGNAGFEFGFDPSMDPELAMALRMSMEDEKNRLAKAEKEKEEKEGKKDEGAEASAAGAAGLEGIREEDENTPLLKEAEGDAGKDKKDDDKMETD